MTLILLSIMRKMSLLKVRKSKLSILTVSPQQTLDFSSRQSQLKSTTVQISFARNALYGIQLQTDMTVQNAQKDTPLLPISQDA